MTELSSPLLKALTLEGFLSFGHGAGSGTKDFPLTPLNVVIGPNGSGKSNLVEAMSVLRAVPRDLPLPIRQGGRVRDWLWRGDPSTTTGPGVDSPSARIEVVFAEGRSPDSIPIRPCGIDWFLGLTGTPSSFETSDWRMLRPRPAWINRISILGTSMAVRC